MFHKFEVLMSWKLSWIIQCFNFSSTPVKNSSKYVDQKNEFVFPSELAQMVRGTCQPLEDKMFKFFKNFLYKMDKNGKIWTWHFHWKTVWYFNKFLFISNAFLEETQFIMIAILQIWKLHTFLDLLWWTYRNWETCTLKFGNMLFRNLVTIYMYNIDFPTMLLPGKMSLGS